MIKKLRPAALAVLTLLTGMALNAQAQDARRSFIVQMVGEPAASYSGNVAGLAATKPTGGSVLNVDASDVQAYISYLDIQQANALAALNPANITQQYRLSFNGFAAMLTDDEVRLLKTNRSVANISADTIQQPTTNFTPTFLGLDTPGTGLWALLGGPGNAGEGMIIGMLDSGVWPESPSFADRVDANGVPTFGTGAGTNAAYGPPPAKWKGTCVVGEGISASSCNNKLIGVRHFLSSSTQVLDPLEFRSGRDAVEGGKGGHGSHTMSTAGGNANVPATSNGAVLGYVSGMAPRARVAAYKVCWGGQGCASSSTIAAVEAAIADGVDVLNYSIGPTAGGGSFTDATTIAFLGASNAGIFLAASAGNAGPTTGPAANLGPWHTTVGNSTHNRLFAGDVTLGNGVVLTGASSNANTPSAQLILAKDAGFAGANALNLSRCFGAADAAAPLLDPAKVTGKVLVCDRGANALVNKSANGAAAGAAGVIISNVAGGATSVINAPHSISTVHLSLANGTIVKNYLAANPGGTAALGNMRTIVDPNVLAPVMNSSSSRGPNVANANILKPDLTAPGTDILATVTPNLNQAQRDAIAAGGSTSSQAWALYTGTSMSSPHVAGIAALLKQQNPSWTPAMIKSALMTTAFDTFADALGGTALPWDSTARAAGKLPWGQGAGHIKPTAAADPGLVYDAGEIDYARFLCGINANTYSPATCQAIGTIQPQNLNLASLTAANVLGSQTLTRTVTNVSAATSTYTATAAVAGFDVVVTPASFTIAPGAKQTYTVKLNRTTAASDTWAYGSLSWSDGTHTVRSPLTARGSKLAAIASVYSEATTGSKIFTIGTGFTGTMTGVKGGVMPATQVDGAVGQKADTAAASVLADCRAGGKPGVTTHVITVPAGNLVTRVALFDADTGDTLGKSDLDLLLFAGDATQTLLANSGGNTSNEMVTLLNLAAGTYKACVVGYSAESASVSYKLSSWVVNVGDSNGNFRALLPARVYLGGTASVGMSWSGLAAGKRHLAALRYSDAAGAVGNILGTTLLEVNTNNPVPMAAGSRPEPITAE